MDEVSVNKVELWNAGGVPKYWTAIFFTASRLDFPVHISRMIKGGKEEGEVWFVDFKAGNRKYAVLKGQVFHYEIGNSIDKEQVRAECKKLGIAEEQMNWPE